MLYTAISMSFLDGDDSIGRLYCTLPPQSALKTGLSLLRRHRDRSATLFLVLLVHRDGSGENKGELERKVLGSNGRRCHLESIGLETTADSGARTSVRGEGGLGKIAPEIIQKCRNEVSNKSSVNYSTFVGQRNVGTIALMHRDRLRPPSFTWLLIRPSPPSLLVHLLQTARRMDPVILHASLSLSLSFSFLSSFPCIIDRLSRFFANNQIGEQVGNLFSSAGWSTNILGKAARPMES